MSAVLGIAAFVGALLATLPLWPRLRGWNPRHGGLWIFLGVGAVPVVASLVVPDSWDAVLLPALCGFVVAGLVTRRRDLNALKQQGRFREL